MIGDDVITGAGLSSGIAALFHDWRQTLTRLSSAGRSSGISPTLRWQPVHQGISRIKFAVAMINAF